MIREIMLPNGYTISIEEEIISKEGRSIYRDFDSVQVVFKIKNESGRVTKRLPIPRSVKNEIAEFLG